jgi:DNA modification methylase
MHKITPPAKPSPSTTPQLSGLVERALALLQPWPGNPRKHAEGQLTKLRASIQRFGFTVPLIVDEANVVLSGHARLQVAQQLGLAAVPVRVISGLTQSEKRAYVLADNKLALLSAWNTDMLKDELALLIEDDFEVEVTGFSTAEIDLMFEEPGDGTDDALSTDLPEAIVTKPGDVWVLGEHRLLCGSALDTPSYDAVLGSELARMCLTDPPYNVAIDGHVSGKGKTKHAEFAMASGEMSSSEFTSFLQRVLEHVSSTEVAGAINCIAMDWRHIKELQEAAAPVFGPAKQLCVWVKDNAGMGTFYRSQHELFFLFKKGEAAHVNNFELGQHGRYRTNVWSYPGANAFKGKGLNLLALHPTCKPVSLFADAIRDCTHRGEIVLDPFCGSGTILIAAERTKRRARAIELDPRYVDVSVRRWERLTDGKATLAATGQTWIQVRAGRAKKAAEGASA